MTTAISGQNRVFQKFPSISQEALRISQALDAQQSGKSFEPSLFIYAAGCKDLVAKSAKLRQVHADLDTALQELTNRVQAACEAIAPSELLKAIRTNDPLLLDSILKVRELQNKKLSNGEMPLHFAIRIKSAEVVKHLLISSRANPLLKDHQGLTAIDHAFLTQDPQMISLVLGASLGKIIPEMDPSAQIDQSEIQELFFQIKRLQHLPMLQPTIQAWQPIHRAAFLGDISRLNELKKEKYSLNSSDAQGMTPLHFAALSGKEEVVEWLIQNGASLRSTSQGMTSLHMAAISGSQAVVKRLLATNQFDPNQADHQGRTALHFALALDHIPLARQIVEHGGDPLIKSAKTTPYALFKVLSSFKAEQRDPLKLDRGALFTLASFVAGAASRYFGYNSAGNFFGALPIFSKLIGLTRGPIYQSMPAFFGLSSAMNSYLQNEIGGKILVQGAQTGLQGLSLAGQIRNSWKNLSLETYRPIRNLIIQTANVAFAAWELWHTYQAHHPDFDVLEDCGNLSQQECILKAGKDFSSIQCDPSNHTCKKNHTFIPTRSVHTNARTVLGLKPDFTNKECTAAHRKLSLQHHPDKTKDLAEKAARGVLFPIINTAKEFLCPK